MSKKLSQITEEATTVNAVDRFYIEQGGVSKYIDGDTMAAEYSGDSVQNKYDATAAPTATDDTSEGYSVGSKWVDVTNDNAYICVDATEDAAVWSQINGNSVNAGAEETNSSIQLQTDLFRSYGQDGARTGSITIDDDNCDLGYCARVIHNDNVTPSIVTDFNILKVGIYVINVNNDIWISKTATDEITVIYTQPTLVSNYVLPTAFTLVDMSQESNNFTSTDATLWSPNAFSDTLISGDGYIEMKYLVTNNSPILIGLSVAVETDYEDVDYAVFVGGDSNIYRRNVGAGTQVSLTAVVVGDIIRIERSGTDVIISRSQNGGASFTTLYTWNSVTSSDLYACIFANGLGKVANNIKVQL